MSVGSGDQPSLAPLAARMRPTEVEAFVGQAHLLAPGKPLRRTLEGGYLHSMILWGPPGVGKTTLARLMAERVAARFETISAVMAGVKDIRNAAERAADARTQGQQTLFFVDEVHRFNKGQQDAFLPYVEDGTVVLVGATTENPSFELNNALLSRTRVYRLRPLDGEDLDGLLRAALSGDAALREMGLEVSDQVRRRIAECADGDARRALNLLEVAADLAEEGEAGRCRVTDEVLDEALVGHSRRFDKGGDLFFDQISALHKAVRGSSPDGALYWYARMLDGGVDPLYVARRAVRIASEDLGNADPRALELTLSAWQAQERLGSPEGELAIAQALVYLACAPKSNAVYQAFNQVTAEVKGQPTYEVPLHLRNAPTKMMKAMGHGGEYRYAHDEPDGYAAGENYLPPELADHRYYRPVDRGFEKRIAEKLEELRRRDQASAWRRYASDGAGGG